MNVRSMCVEDASAMREIYRPYVEASVISFEEQVPSLEEMQERTRKYLHGWAGFVCEVGGRVQGYAYGSAHRERAARLGLPPARVVKASVTKPVYHSPSIPNLGGRSNR